MMQPAYSMDRTAIFAADLLDFPVVYGRRIDWKYAYAFIMSVIIKVEILKVKFINRLQSDYREYCLRLMAQVISSK